MVSSTSKKTENILIVLLFLSGFGQVVDYYFPFKIYGYSVLLTWLPFLSSVVLLLFTLKSESEKNIFLLWLFFILLIILLICRHLFYGESIIVNIVNFRFSFFIPAFIIGIKNLFRGTYKSLYFFSIILLIYLFHVSNSLAYLMNLYSIDSGEQIVEFGRFRGIMAGSNVSANFIVTLYAIMQLSKKEIKMLHFLISSSLAVIGIAPFLSRGAMLVFVLIFSFKFFQLLKMSGGVTFLINVFLVFMLSYFIISNLSVFESLDTYNSFLNRFDGVQSGREDRNLYFLVLMGSNMLYWILGIDNQSLLINGDEDMSISDNSFTLLFSSFGLVVGLLFIYLVYSVSSLDKHKFRINLYFYLFILSIILYFNNSALWTSWTFIAVFGIFYIRSNTQSYMC